MNWIPVDDNLTLPRIPGWYLVKVVQGKGTQYPFSPYVVIKIGKIPKWGTLIEKYLWTPTDYARIEEAGYMREGQPKPVSVFATPLISSKSPVTPQLPHIS